MKQDIDEKKLIDEFYNLFKLWNKKNKDKDSFELGLTLGLKAGQIILYAEEENPKIKKEFAKLFNFNESNIELELEKFINKERNKLS